MKNPFNELSTTILIQLYRASYCNNSDAVLNLSQLATSNGISYRVQNRVLALANQANHIEDIFNTVMGIVIQSDVEEDIFLNMTNPPKNL